MPVVFNQSSVLSGTVFLSEEAARTWIQEFWPAREPVYIRKNRVSAADGQLVFLKDSSGSLNYAGELLHVRIHGS